ncbi:hypothetical protein BC830DRAFT_947618 [Chytriomyces sp. MP71]|nr:hypothetical protein BC830DRAFT_947618 [Chytriomyces sp. MP71]
MLFQFLPTTFPLLSPATSQPALNLQMPVMFPSARASHPLRPTCTLLLVALVRPLWMGWLISSEIMKSRYHKTRCAATTAVSRTDLAAKGLVYCGQQGHLVGSLAVSGSVSPFSNSNSCLHKYPKKGNGSLLRHCHGPSSHRAL